MNVFRSAHGVARLPRSIVFLAFLMSAAALTQTGAAAPFDGSGPVETTVPAGQAGPEADAAALDAARAIATALVQSSAGGGTQFTSASPLPPSNGTVDFTSLPPGETAIRNVNDGSLFTVTPEGSLFYWYIDSRGALQVQAVIVVGSGPASAAATTPVTGAEDGGSFSTPTADELDAIMEQVERSLRQNEPSGATGAAPSIGGEQPARVNNPQNQPSTGMPGTSGTAPPGSTVTPFGFPVQLPNGAIWNVNPYGTVTFGIPVVGTAIVRTATVRRNPDGSLLFVDSSQDDAGAVSSETSSVFTPSGSLVSERRFDSDGTLDFRIRLNDDQTVRIEIQPADSHGVVPYSLLRSWTSTAPSGDIRVQLQADTGMLDRLPGGRDPRSDINRVIDASMRRVLMSDDAWRSLRRRSRSFEFLLPPRGSSLPRISNTSLELRAIRRDSILFSNLNPPGLRRERPDMPATRFTLSGPARITQIVTYRARAAGTSTPEGTISIVPVTEGQPSRRSRASLRARFRKGVNFQYRTLTGELYELRATPSCPGGCYLPAGTYEITDAEPETSVSSASPRTSGFAAISGVYVPRIDPGGTVLTDSPTSATGPAASGGSPLRYVLPIAGAGGAAAIFLARNGSSSTQPTSGCTFSISPTNINAAAAGETDAITINVTPSACAPNSWTAQAGSSFVGVSPSSGAGTGQVTVTTAPNTGPARTGTVAIAGQTLTVNQAAPPACSAVAVSPNPVTLASGGGSQNESVALMPAGCLSNTWLVTATANPGSFISSITPTTGTGNGTFSFSASPNTGASRTASLRISTPATGTPTASIDLSIVQSATVCTYSFSSSVTRLSAAGGTLSLAITNPENCNWRASFVQPTSSSLPMLTFASGSTDGGATATGAGSKSLVVSVSPLPPTLTTRVGMIVLTDVSSNTQKGLLNVTQP